MAAETELHAVWEGAFDVDGCVIKVFILNDGQRGVDYDSFWGFLTHMGERPIGEADGLEDLARWVAGGFDA